METAREVPIGQDLIQLRRERDLYMRLLRLGRSSALEALLDEALALAVAATGARQGYLELHGATEDAPGWSATRGFSEAEAGRVQQGISRGIIAEALATGRTVATAAATRDARFRHRQSVRLARIGAVLCTPVGSDPPMGALYLHGRHGKASFDDGDRATAELVAHHLSPFADRLIARERARAAADPTRAPRATLRAEGIVGASEALAEALRQVQLVAPLDVTVLLLGQSGTGKTHLARVIHESSPRAGKPFVQFTCGGMSETVVEGELFGVAGTERSAPVGPLAGGLAVADEGTLLLEDVANLPPPTQARLLHVLQPPALPPPGASPTLPVGVRVLAATDVDLAAAVAAGRFREDLYQRLAILPIRLPSLAERREDIAPLAAHFARRAAERHGLPHLALSPAAVRTLEAMEWPGNVRQLANAVEIGAIRAAGGGAHSIERSHLVSGDHQGPLTLQEATRRFQTRFLREVLESAEWNVDDVAGRLELPRSHVYALIRAFGLERAKRRGEP